jgi:hypothetical protein
MDVDSQGVYRPTSGADFTVRDFDGLALSNARETA